MKAQMIITIAKRYQLPVAVIMTVWLSTSVLTGQDSKKTDIENPETVVLLTKDNVELRAEWFPGKPGKTTVPVILIHDWAGNRKDLYALANILHREKGFSVIVPDLRGHGQSTSRKNSDKEIKAKDFRKNDFIGILEDIESCKRFLVSKNNLGEVNIDLLVIGVVGKMSPFAVDYTLRDWQWTPLAGIKQGQDVKAIVMISPEKKFKSASMTPAFKIPLISGKNVEPIPIFLTWGKDHPLTSREGQSIYSTLAGSRREDAANTPLDEKWEKLTVIQREYNSKSSGERLVEEKSKLISGDIGLFIEKKVADRKDEFRWQDRSRK